VPELPLLELPPLDAVPVPDVALLGVGVVPPPEELTVPLLTDVPPDVAPDDPPLVGPLLDAAPPFVDAVPPVSSVTNTGDAGLSVLED